MKESLLTDNVLALKFLLDSPVYVLKQDINTSIKEESVTESAIIDKPIAFKGGFAKKILFVISGDNVKLSDNDWDLFNKTIAALKLSEDDLAIIENNADSQIIDLAMIINELMPNKTIVFGKVNSSDTLNTSILKCETLKALSENKDLKVKWWNSLKAYLS